MSQSKQAKRLLEAMAAIVRMERGKLCRMADRPHYNLQAWHNGKNEVRYVREEELDDLRKALTGYQRFWKLAQAYADEIINQTRREHQKRFPTKAKRRTPKIGR